MSKLTLEIVTAEKSVFSGEVDSLTAPAHSGEIGVLPNHAPFLTMIDSGEIRVVINNEETFMVVSGGFLEVMQNKVTILADTVERLEEIDQERAQKALEKAQERLSSKDSDVDFERVLASIRKSQIRLNLVNKRRKNRPGKSNVSSN